MTNKKRKREKRKEKYNSKWTAEDTHRGMFSSKAYVETGKSTNKMP
jgi:hypothetical protein